jgi:hypothetical protein
MKGHQHPNVQVTAGSGDTCTPALNFRVFPVFEHVVSALRAVQTGQSGTIAASEKHAKQAISADCSANCIQNLKTGAQFDCNAAWNAVTQIGAGCVF